MQKRIFASLLTVLIPTLIQADQMKTYPATPSSIEVKVQQVPDSQDSSINQSQYHSNQTSYGQSTSYYDPSTTINTQLSNPIGNKEKTLSIIKPDGVASNHVGDIISHFEQNGLRIAAIKMTRLTKDQASRFYQVHHDRPFYNDLVNFMSSGPVVIMVLEGDQAIAKNRQLMGATNPKQADTNTIRAKYAESVTRNAVHGSDSPEAAKEEISFFFQPNEINERY